MSRQIKSASSGQSIPLSRKLDEATRQFIKLVVLRNPFKKRDYSHLERDMSEYVRIYSKFAHGDFRSASVFELGCGQRPYRLFYLIAHGIQARGIDMDRVVFGFGFSDIYASLLDNGLERTLKTLARYYLFDIAENRQFKKLLGNIKGAQFDWPIDSISQGDATEPTNWPHEDIDFIYSEDVFEHIPAESLHRLCKAMASRLTQNGIALIRPMVFTGIQGGHNVEYYNLEEFVSRRCPPWDHLRSHRYPANTYLNGLSLADYRALFSQYFEIVDETTRDPERGRSFMTDAIRDELSDWTDEELFSNHVRFVLQRKRD